MSDDLSAIEAADALITDVIDQIEDIIKANRATSLVEDLEYHDVWLESWLDDLIIARLHLRTEGKL